ncbi:MAG: hypothetical protein QOE09_1368 [Ilumatobacteraceae bacterium]
MNTRLSGRALEGIVGGDFSDPTNQRLIYLSAAGLAVVGLALLVGTILWWKRGRQEHPALGPLEVMGRRSWEKAPVSDRRRRLDQVRPAGAAMGVVEEEVVRSEPVDLQALVRSVPQAFDDLREPGQQPVPAESLAEEPVAEEAVAEEAVAEEAVIDEGSAVEEEAAADEVEPDAEPVAQDESEAVVVETPSDAESDSTDATSVSTERPSQVVEVVEVVAGGPSDSSD